MHHGVATAKRKSGCLCGLWYTNTSSSLAPKYEELAQLYASNSDYAEKVTIAKVDATLNDVPDEIQGFPTIKLFPAGSKGSPVDYSGPRTIEDLADFIKVNGKYKVDAYVSNETSEDKEMPDADTTMPKQAPAATVSGGIKESVKSAASEAAEVVKTIIVDSDEGGAQEHDEL